MLKIQYSSVNEFSETIERSMISVERVMIKLKRYGQRGIEKSTIVKFVQ